MRLTVCFLLAVEAFAQTSPSGLDPTWDVAVILEQIGKDTAGLLPVLDQVRVADWVAKGASDTYGLQLQSARDQARGIVEESKALARNPEKFSAGLQLFFRFEGLETMLLSLEEAARRYQGGQIAQTLAATFAESSANRDRFRNFIVNLAIERERQFEVMDQEAQRCRATLMAPPAKSKVRKR